MRGDVLAFLVVLAGAATVSCQAAGCVADDLGNIVGETGNAACDRRYVADGGSRSPFCQEVIDTVAQSQFEDDCRTKFQAQTYSDKCPRGDIIAGCENDTVNEDGSHVWDWYYDVSGIELEAGVEAGTLFPVVPHTVADVAAYCADPMRYSGGATLASP